MRRKSRPTRARGLKWQRDSISHIGDKSRPTRARGLKSHCKANEGTLVSRAPRGRVD